ncbi:MAG TPA: hypothetical protein VGZ22_00395 [Isosphaeraceae bacterium]|jgi:hypothetical protein|nr:hypothetical protein [Isosphaeraceae bacterium]
MKEKRRRLPEVVRPLETLDDRIVPATLAVPVPGPTNLFGPFIPGHPVEMPNATASSGMLRSFTIARSAAPGSTTAQSSLFSAHPSSLLTSPFHSATGFGTVPFGAGQSLFVNTALPGVGGVRPAVAARLSAITPRTTGGLTTFHGKILVPFVNFDSGLRPFLPNFGASSTFLTSSSGLIPFLGLLSNNNTNTIPTTTTTTTGTTTVGVAGTMINVTPMGVTTVGFGNI